jgi:hypothetical protein
MFDAEMLFQKSNGRQLDPSVHTIYRGTKAHDFILYKEDSFW